ncbi:MAG: 2-oxoacid:acceptor oxidoreductase family protein [Anaerolineae bacterium]|nr:2-oxoacid:acceptor oxidoreductase family protein [Anaerolineae bacterium]
MNDKILDKHADGSNPFNIYLIGVGGQGVLTIGELIAEAAFQAGIPVNFYPTKGMAQRGGAVKAQLRLGRAGAGPNIPEKGAGLVIATERSESLKAVRFIKPGGDFLLFGHVWSPLADHSQGKHEAPYPSLEQVQAQVQAAGGNLHYLDPRQLPLYEGTPVPANIYVLGAALGHTSLGRLLDATKVAALIRARWKRGAERNAFAFQAGCM